MEDKWAEEKEFLQCDLHASKSKIRDSEEKLKSLLTKFKMEKELLGTKRNKMGKCSARVR